MSLDSSNHWYGHAHILAEYCGLDPQNPPRIDGVLQHGWTFVHGFGGSHQPPHGFTKFAWSDVCRRRGQAIGWRDYQVIGAPFLYLDKVMPPGPDDPEPEGTIWYPFHGTKDFEQVEGDHGSLIDEIRAHEDGPVTVCLYYVEYDDPEVRKHYEDSGFRVICHGRRGLFWQGGDTDFLRKQLKELRLHKRVASNRLSTAIFYGAAIGLQPAVYGDPMQFVGGKEGFDFTELLEHFYPELHGTAIDRPTAQAIALRELGADALMSAQELRVALGWQGIWQAEQERRALEHGAAGGSEMFTNDAQNRMTA